MDRTQLSQILHSIIVADAFASPLDNLSAEHIHNVFSTLHDYTDPTPALKHKLHLWKKPGLYTALSQYCIILSAINIHSQFFNYQHVSQFIISLGDSSHVFRHPQGFLQHLDSLYDSPTSELLICIPTLFFLQKQHPESIINFILTHNKNAATFSSSLFLYNLLEEIFKRQLITCDTSVLHTAAIHTVEFTHTYSSAIFDNGGNPQKVIEAAKDLYLMIEKLPLTDDETSLTQHCVTFASRWSKNTYTRLNVNHPFALLPLAVYCINTYEKDSLLFSAIKRGGKVSLLVPLVAIIATALYGFDVIPQMLIQNLINKKRISQFIKLLQENSVSINFLHEFFMNEEKMTRKEHEELESKLKHVTPKSSKKKTEDKYSSMTYHVVESWTKLDKAKWKKERRKK
ncbi:MAG: hypothetical protein N3F66_08110 [Spirochaetes bacterium]|nr:hypothetical protein [Spirochaetota bacterium]